MTSKNEGEVTAAGAKSDGNASQTPSKKVFMKASEIRDLSRDEITARYSELEKYITSLEDKTEGQSAPELEEKLKLQQQESTRRENVLVMRLATKEQEMQELVAQIHELKQSQTPSTSQLKSTLLDPSVNLLFEKMKTELGETKEKLEQAQNDLSAWKFTPDRFVKLTYLNQMKHSRKKSRELEHKLISQDEQLNCITRDAQCAVLKTLINIYFQVNNFIYCKELCSQGHCCLVNIKSKTLYSYLYDDMQRTIAGQSVYQCICVISYCILELWVKIISDVI